LLALFTAKAALGEESSGSSAASTLNCKASGFNPIYYNGWYSNVDREKMIWRNKLRLNIWFEPVLNCWIANDQWIDTTRMSKREKFAVQSMGWPAVNCINDSGDALPQNGWTGNINRQIFEQGTFVCSDNPAEPATAEERDALQKDLDMGLGSKTLSREMGIATVVVFFFWVILCACKWRSSQTRHARMLELAHLGHARRQEERERSKACSGLMEMSFSGQTETLGGETQRRYKHPKQIALEAVYFLQQQLTGSMKVLCPPERHPRPPAPGEAPASRETCGLEHEITWKHDAGVAAPRDGEVVEECCICMENVPDIRHMPCGHACECRMCFSQRMVDWKMSSAPACPICRGSITTVLVDMTKRYEIEPPQKLPSLANLPDDNLTDAQIRTDMVYFSGPPGPTPNQTSATGPAGEALPQSVQGGSDGGPIVASSVPLMQSGAAQDQQTGFQHQEQQQQRVWRQPSSASLGPENHRDDEHPAAYSMNSHPRNAPASSTDSFPGLVTPARPRQLSTTGGTPVRVTPRLHSAEASAHNLTSSVVIRDVNDDARSSGSAVPEAAAEAPAPRRPSTNYPNYPM